MKWKDLKIIIVNDDTDYGNSLQLHLLKNQIKQVDIYHSAVECLRSSEQIPDVIFVEHKMSEIDGARASRMFKRKWKHVRIILISSSIRAKNRINRRKFGIDNIVDKSIDFEEVVNEIKIYNYLRWLKSLQYLLYIVISVSVFRFLLHL
jgi:DNA-binding response OmpR family regulator